MADDGAPAFADRVRAMARVCGPQSWPSLLASEAEILRAISVVRGETAATGRQDAERARYLVDTSVHPDTGEIQPLPFRMAAHVPANTVLLVMMLSSKSVLATAAAQLANQSFNAMQFWTNRNGSNDIDTRVFAASFFGSVAASVGVGVALRRWELRSASRLARGGAAAWFALQCIPLVAAGAAKPLQIGVMRQDELLEGVAVRLPDGAAVVDPDTGDALRSRAAGRAAVGTTVASRLLYLVPPMVVPPVAMAALGPALAAAHPALRAAVFVLLCGGMSAVTTPVCMALWEQRMSLPLESLEADVRAAAEAQQPGAGFVTFNKGL